MQHTENVCPKTLLQQSVHGRAVTRHCSLAAGAVRSDTKSGTKYATRPGIWVPDLVPDLVTNLMPDLVVVLVCTTLHRHAPNMKLYTVFLHITPLRH